MMNGEMGFGMFFGMISAILLVIGLGMLLIIVIQKAFGGGKNSSHESALEILKKRYARGEITKEEFEEKNKKIQCNEEKSLKS